VDGMSNKKNTRAFQISLEGYEILHTDNHHARSNVLLCVIHEYWKRLKSRNFTLHRSFELRVFKSLYSQTYCILKQTRLLRKINENPRFCRKNSSAKRQNCSFCL